MSAKLDRTIPEVIHHLLQDDGTFPNNAALPLVIQTGVFPVSGEGKADPRVIESAFDSHQWRSSWRNGLYTMHHYHSTAHEALGIFSGTVRAQFGGPDGPVLTASAGDVVIIPAGVAHKNISSSPDFRVVGAYPAGQQWDMNYGRKEERPQADSNIRAVPLPDQDPAGGIGGPLMELWKLL